MVDSIVIPNMQREFNVNFGAKFSRERSVIETTTTKTTTTKKNNR
jgi:hypothetical protein